MASSTFNSRPSTPISWADDDEDDFDLDAWKATVDNSAPTVQDLGPLQPTHAQEEEETFSLSVSKVANEPTARVATEDHATYTDGLREEPQKSAATTTTTPETADSDWTPSEEQIYEWQCTQAREWLLKLAIKKAPDVPAYPEVSMYSDGTPSPDVRIDYVRNWNYMKSLRVKNSRSIVYQYRSSRLRQVSFADDEHPELEAIDEADEEFSQVALDVATDGQLEPSSEEEVDEALTPPTPSPIPILNARGHEGDELAEMDPQTTWNGDSDVEEIDTMPLERPKLNPFHRHRVNDPASDDEQVMRFSGGDSLSDTELEFEFDDIFDRSSHEWSSSTSDDESRGLTEIRHSEAPRRHLSLGSFELPIRSRPFHGVSTSGLESQSPAAIDEAANSDNAANEDHGTSSEPPQQDEARQFDSESPDVVQSDGAVSSFDFVSPHSKRDESHEVEPTLASPQPSPALRVPAHSPLLSAGQKTKSEGTRQAGVSVTDVSSQSPLSPLSPSSEAPTPTSPQVPTSSGSSEKVAQLSQNNWPTLSSLPSWTTIGAFAAGVVVGGLFSVACRRCSR